MVVDPGDTESWWIDRRWCSVHGRQEQETSLVLIPKTLFAITPPPSINISPANPTPQPPSAILVTIHTDLLSTSINCYWLSVTILSLIRYWYTFSKILRERVRYRRLREKSLLNKTHQKEWTTEVDQGVSKLYSWLVSSVNYFTCLPAGRRKQEKEILKFV